MIAIQSPTANGHGPTPAKGDDPNPGGPREGAAQTTNGVSEEEVQQRQADLVAMFFAEETTFQDIAMSQVYYAPMQADDVRSTALLAGYVGLTKYVFQEGYTPEALRSWFIRIIINAANDQRDKDAHVDEGEMNDEWMSPGSCLTDAEQVEENIDVNALLAVAIDKLTEIERQALACIDLDEMTYKEAAGHLGRKETSVKNGLAAGRKKIRELDEQRILAAKENLARATGRQGSESAAEEAKTGS